MAARRSVLRRLTGLAAAALGGPLLLTDPQHLPASTAAEIRRIAPARLVVAGGPGAVSDAVLAQVRAIVPDTVRLGGADRYETSAKIVSEAFAGGAGEAIVVTGQNFPDALTGGSLAVGRDAPVLIVDHADPVSVRRMDESLAMLGVERVVIVGGTGVVSAAIESRIAGSGVAVSRIDGADRYAVSEQVAGSFPAGTGVIVATGADYPDALAATGLAARRGQPILLTHPACVTPSYAAAIRGLAPASITITGRRARARRRRCRVSVDDGCGKPLGHGQQAQPAASDPLRTR